MAIPVNVVEGTIETVVNVDDIGTINVVNYVSVVNAVTDVDNVNSVNLVDLVTAVTAVDNVNSVNLVDLVTAVTDVDNVNSVNLVDLVTAVTDVNNVNNVNSIDLVDLVTAVTDVANVNSVDLVDLVTAVTTVATVSELVKETDDSMTISTANTGTANTPLQMSAGAANKFVLIRSRDDNTTDQPIWVGGSDVDAENSANGYPLDAGESLLLPVENANMVYLDSQSADQNFSIVIV